MPSGHFFFAKRIAILIIILYNDHANLCFYIDTPSGKEQSMTVWLEITAVTVLAFGLLILLIRSAAAKSRDRKWRAAERKLETVLLPKETVKVVCPQKKGRVILTSKRLLFETKEGFTAVVLKDIKSVRGNTKDKKATTVPAKMVSLTVKGPEEYMIYNSCGEFADLAKQLRDKIKKQNAKKKKK